MELASGRFEALDPDILGEQYSRSILGCIKDMVSVIDSSFRILWTNHFWDGRPHPQPAIGSICYQVWRNRQEPCGDGCPVAKVLATGRPGLTERCVAQPNGSDLWSEVRVYPAFDQAGQVSYVIKIAFDITRRKQRQQQRLRYWESLEQSLALLNRSQALPGSPEEVYGLTPRETEVLRLLAQGMTNPQIARVLAISPHTAKSHVVHIFNKLGVGDRTQAAVWAARQGLV